MYRVLPPFWRNPDNAEKASRPRGKRNCKSGNSAVDNPGNRAIMNHIRESEEEKSRLREV